MSAEIIHSHYLYIAMEEPQNHSMDISEMSDEQIAERIQEGRAEDFKFIVDRYQERLIRYGRKILFNPSDVEDIVQEVFIKAYKNFQSYDTSRKFSSWIYRIAHNEFINHGKKFSRLALDYFDLEVFLPHKASATDVESDFDREQLKGMVESSVNSLPTKYREPFVLYCYEGLDYKEIADVLRLPTSTVGVRILRAKQLLKKQIQNNGRTH